MVFKLVWLLIVLFQNNPTKHIEICSRRLFQFWRRLNFNVFGFVKTATYLLCLVIFPHKNVSQRAVVRTINMVKFLRNISLTWLPKGRSSVCSLLLHNSLLIHVSKLKSCQFYKLEIGTVTTCEFRTCNDQVRRETTITIDMNGCVFKVRILTEHSWGINCFIGGIRSSWLNLEFGYVRRLILCSYRGYFEH